MAGWVDGAVQVLAEQAGSAPGVRVGTLAVVDAERGVWVSCGGDAPVEARSTVPLSPTLAGKRVLLVHEEGAADRPIVIGVVQDAPVIREMPARGREVRIEGKALHLEGDEEVTLRCGKASITLQADGRIEIRGVEIVSRARGTHKVKGATVLIN